MYHHVIMNLPSEGQKPQPIHSFFSLKVYFPRELVFYWGTDRGCGTTPCCQRVNCFNPKGITWESIQLERGTSILQSCKTKASSHQEMLGQVRGRLEPAPRVSVPPPPPPSFLSLPYLHSPTHREQGAKGKKGKHSSWGLITRKI